MRRSRGPPEFVAVLRALGNDGSRVGKGLHTPDNQLGILRIDDRASNGGGKPVCYLSLAQLSGARWLRGGGR